MTVSAQVDKAGDERSAGAQGVLRRGFLRSALKEIRQSNKWGYIFILPLVIDFAIFTVYLIVRGLMMSFQQVTFGAFDWIGLENYRFLFTDLRFFNALKNTFVYTVAVVPGGILLSILISEMIFRRSTAVQTFFKSAYYLPAVVSTVAWSLVWIFIYQPFYGILNFITSLVGMKAINWVGNPTTAMPAIVFMGIVGSVGTSVVFITASMGSISTEYYDAAKIDGASEWQRLWRITVPLLRPTLLYLFVVGFIGNFQLFEQIYVMTAGGPGYPGATETVGYMIFSSAFGAFNLGYAAAQSVLLFVVILLVSMIQFRFFSTDVEF
jgi:multiple sugar transport system permease protein